VTVQVKSVGLTPNPPLLPPSFPLEISSVIPELGMIEFCPCVLCDVLGFTATLIFWFFDLKWKDMLSLFFPLRWVFFPACPIMPLFESFSVSLPKGSSLKNGTTLFKSPGPPSPTRPESFFSPDPAGNPSLPPSFVFSLPPLG